MSVFLQFWFHWSIWKKKCSGCINPGSAFTLLLPSGVFRGNSQGFWFISDCIKLMPSNSKFKMTDALLFSSAYEFYCKDKFICKLNRSLTCALRLELCYFTKGNPLCCSGTCNVNVPLGISKKIVWGSMLIFSCEKYRQLELIYVQEWSCISLIFSNTF